MSIEREDPVMVKSLLNQKRIWELEAENKKLRAALEWYASPRTWNQWLPDSAGDRARNALRGGAE